VPPAPVTCPAGAGIVKEGASMTPLGGSAVDTVTRLVMVVVLLALLPRLGRKSLQYLREAPGPRNGNDNARRARRPSHGVTDASWGERNSAGEGAGGTRLTATADRPKPSSFPVARCRFPVPASQSFPVARCRFPPPSRSRLPGCPLPVAGCPLPVAPLPVARCPLPVARCPLPVARCPLPVARCPLPVARCPLPIARCPLPIPHCRLPVAGCRSPVARSRPYAIVSKRSMGTAPATGLPAKQSSSACTAVSPISQYP